jgi:hypothetical protein
MFDRHIRDAFATAHIFKLFHDAGRLDKLPAGFNVDEDDYWTLICEALDRVTDFVKQRHDGDGFWQEYYYQDPAMTEYYRLCEAYNRLCKIDMESNPYYQKARLCIIYFLENVGDRVGYAINPKTNHKWSCRLTVIINGEYFYEYVALIEALFGIFDFYKKEVAALLEKLQVLSAEKEKQEAA